MIGYLPCMLTLLLSVACGNPEGARLGPDTRTGPPPGSVTLVSSEQWGEPGCDVNGGNQQSFEARYEVDPPHADPAATKPFRGEWLVQDDGTRWLVSYAGGRFHPELDGLRVQATGAPCVKQGQSLSAEHFMLYALRKLVP